MTSQNYLNGISTQKHCYFPVDYGKTELTQTRVTIGHTVDTDEPVDIGDIERRSGFYILGRTGMGKSELEAKLALDDIKNNHGVFFIDPHGETIDKIIARLPPEREGDVILLDPTDKDHTFGINLLSCKDVSDIAQRNDAYNKARGFFERIEQIWGDSVGLWLQLISSHTLEVFINNQGYTLAEVPLFLDLKNPAFRNLLVSKMRPDTTSAYYWQKTFAAQNKKDQEAKIDPLRTRVEILCAREYVRHVIGQVQTTIDFPTIMRERKIVLLKLTARLAIDEKRFLGTLLISELLHAVMKREEIPEEERHQFCIFVDEFQNFTYSEDFSTLFTQARKYGVATTVAHQERYGQFADNKEILGATDAAANKIFFQLTVRDSKEQAPEFAKVPPAETKREPVLVISLDPFPTLLRGHDNPQIREFIRRYLQPLQYRLEDIKEEMEGEKLLRQYFVDKAGLYRVYERIAALKERLGYDPVKYINVQYNALEVQKDALMGALGQSEKLMSMHQGYTQLRLRLRSLNDFFTSLMEGRIAPGNEEFSLFIASFVCASSFSLVPIKYVKLLTLYISLKYGNPKIPRTIPYALAQVHGVFQNEVSLLTRQAMGKTRKARQEFQESYLKKEWEKYRSQRKWEAEKLERELAKIRSKRIYYDQLDGYQRLLEKCEKFEVYMLEHRLRDYRAIEEILDHREIEGRILCDFEKEKRRIWLPPHVYELYVWLLAYPDLWNLLVPYSTTQFDNRWKELLTNFGYATNIDKLILQIGWSFDENFKYYFSSDGYFPCPCDNCKEYRWYVWSHMSGYRMDHYGWFLKKNIIKKLKKFLQQYKEGAFVMLTLLDAARDSDWNWKAGRGTLNLPGIAGTEPIEVLRLTKKLNELMLLIQKDYDKFLSIFLTYFERVRSYWNKSRDEYLYGLKKDGGISLEVKPFELIKHQDEREGVRFLKIVLNSQWGWFSQQYPAAARQWLRSDELTRSYLLSRAYDLVCFGERIANQTFPQPTFSGAKDLVSALACLLKDTEARLVEKKQREIDERLRVEEAKKREEIKRECAEKMANISIAPLENLDPVVLSENELKAFKEACLIELYRTDPRDWDVNAALKVIDEFVQFCVLLKQPENHIKVASGQYIETHKPSRQVQDMANEMAQELINLDPHYAYAKVIQRQNGEQVVVKKKIRTLKLPEPRLQRDALADFISQIKNNTIRSGYVKKRSNIEEEIRFRQEKWQSHLPGSTRLIPPFEEPPPTYYSRQIPEEDVKLVTPPSFKPVLLDMVFYDRKAVAGPYNEAEKQKSNLKERLLYRSNFYFPDTDNWDEGTSDSGRSKTFRQDGYYHIAINHTPLSCWQCPKIPITDFRVHVDAAFTSNSGNTGLYGFVFRQRTDEGKDSCYSFTISRSGRYALLLYANEEWHAVLDYQISEFIRPDDNINSLMVEMVGQKITLGINDHVLATAMDSRLRSGNVGLSVTSYPDGSYTEARFRNFQLYSLEQ